MSRHSSSLLKKIGKVLAVLVAVVIVLGGIYVGYAMATAKRRLAFPDTPFPQIVASRDPATIERGRYLVRGPAHCAGCHAGAPGTPPDIAHPEALLDENLPLAGGLELAMGPLATFYAANLTPDPETGIGKLTDAAVARAVRTGILHDGSFSIFMRFAAARLSDEDLSAVVSYLRSLPPIRNPVRRAEWKLLGKVMLPMFPLAPRGVAGPTGVQAGAEPTLERGAYLAEHAALCVTCHTATDERTFEPVGPKAAGGSPDQSHGADVDMEFVPPNLTADPRAGYTGRADEQAFLTRIRAGRAITSSIMPWENFTKMTDSDIRSIYRYLRSLPPVNNDLGPSYRKKGWRSPVR